MASARHLSPARPGARRGGWLLPGAAGLLSLYLGFCGLLFVRQRSLLYLPQPRAAVAGNELLRLAGAGGVLEVSAAQRQHRAAVLYFGGNAEDVAQTVPSLRLLFPQRPIDALHYRGYGGSGGRPSEQAQVGDAVQVLDQLRPRHPDVVVIGRSLGSGVAVQQARLLTRRFAPGLVRYVEVPDARHNSPLLESPALRPLLRGS